MLALEKTAIIGLGARTGSSLLRYFQSQSEHLIVVDDKTQEQCKDVLNGMQVIFEHTAQLDQAFACRRWIVSPGIPLSKAYFAKARALGIELVSEIDFSLSKIHAPLLAISGSNGKSTTVSLLGHLLQHSEKKNVFVGGNLGTPLIEAVGKTWDALVVELSSFQL